MNEKQIELINEVIHKIDISPDLQAGVIGNEIVFHFCQQVKGYFPDKAQAEDAEEFFLEWFEQVDDKILDEDGLPISKDEALSMLYECWDKVKYPAGIKNKIALKRAKERKIILPELQQFSDEKVILLGTVCYELQELNNGESFFISGYNAGDILVLEQFCNDKNLARQRRGDRILKLFESKDIIKLLSKGHSGVSSTYRYITNTSAAKKQTFEQSRQGNLEALEIK